MFSSLFKRPAPKMASAPPGVVAYAIGDIHGRADLLRALMGAILQDWDSESEHRTEVVFLGDYIDRGPASCEVLNMLIDFAKVPGVTWTFLRGNHEQALLDFLEDPSFGVSWCAYGGREALASYGVQAPFGSDARLWRDTRDAFERAFPKAHLAFLQSLPTRYELGDYFFAHAGARPGVPLAKQADRDLTMIRNSFLDDARAFDRVVVHGHSIVTEAHTDHRRIGIDTGAYKTGVLTALRLEGQRRELLQTAVQGDDVRVSRKPIEP